MSTKKVMSLIIINRQVFSDQSRKLLPMYIIMIINNGPFSLFFLLFYTTDCFIFRVCYGENCWLKIVFQGRSHLPSRNLKKARPFDSGFCCFRIFNEMKVFYSYCQTRDISRQHPDIVYFSADSNSKRLWVQVLVKLVLNWPWVWLLLCNEQVSFFSSN